MTRPAARAVLPTTFKDEDEFGAAVCEMAKRMQCLVWHTHDSRRSEPGFPDVLIVGRSGVLFRKLKTETGRVSPEQQTWLGKLARAGADVAVWRPSDWPNRVAAEIRGVNR